MRAVVTILLAVVGIRQYLRRSLLLRHWLAEELRPNMPRRTAGSLSSLTAAAFLLLLSMLLWLLVW
jgi:hypothetical protein